MKSTSYIENSLEVSKRLGSIVSYIYQDSNLNKVFLLKGGLAVQLYLEEFKRLFFDIDLDVLSPLEEPLNDSIKHQIKEEFLLCM